MRSAITLLLFGVLASPALAQQRSAEDELHELRTRVRALEVQVGALLNKLQALEEQRRPRRYLAGDEDGPRVPGHAWLALHEGVLYFRPVPVTRLLAAQLRSSWSALQEYLGGVEVARVLSEGQLVLQLSALPAGHPLATRLGLELGDRLLTLNGRPLVGEGQALYEALSGQSRFALEVQRGEQRLLVSFYVQDDERPSQVPPARSDYRLVAATGNPEHPERNSVVVEVPGRGQRVLVVGDELDGLTVRRITIERAFDVTEAVLVLGRGEREETIRLARGE